MQSNIIDFKDLSDSKEMMLTKPNPWMTRFIYLLIIILIAALTWSYYGEMDEYVKAVGVVRPVDKVSTVVNQVSGEVKEVYIHEGTQVNEGDLLLVIAHDELLLEKDLYEKQLGETELQINHLNLMRNSVDKMRNAFDKKVEEQQTWYYQYQKFETDYRLEEQNIELEVQNQQINQKRLQEEMVNLAGYQLLLDSINSGLNLFTEKNNSYALKYEDYIKNLNTMTQELNKATDDLSKAENMYALQIIPKKEIDEAKFLKESIERKMETYKNQFMLSISENMENIQKTIKNIENSFIEVEGELRLQKIRNDKLVALDQSIEVEKQKLPQISNKLDSISLAIENCSVYAKVSGKMHVLREFRKGDKLQSGVELATILPENDEELKVQLFISNSDISSIKTGDSVKFHFYALPYKEYGELTGTISTISSDAQINQTDGLSYYHAEAVLDNKELVGRKGQEESILVGMTCEAQVISGSKKILYWLLEKIDLRD